MAAISTLPASSSLNVEAIISKLLDVRGGKPGTAVNLSEKEVRDLIHSSRQIVLEQPVLLELEAPICIVGDVHAQVSLICNLTYHYFLGDYVDRGKQGLETICLLLAYKIKYPENFFLLRGNHECASITRIYGFYDECRRRLSSKVWGLFCGLFNCLPLAAIVDDKIFCVHAGLSPDLTASNVQVPLTMIQEVQRPTDVPEAGIVCDLLWADPERDISGWAENDRGVSFTFGQNEVNRFLRRNDYDLVVRAHQVVENGYEFFAGRKLVTIFSAPNYCGEFDNAAAMMVIDDTLMCSFKVLKPVKKNKNA